MNKRRLLTDRGMPPGSITGYLIETLTRIKQETNDEFVRSTAQNAILKVSKCNSYEEAIYEMASKRLDGPDDYIRKAKQAISDAEDIFYV